MLPVRGVPDEDVPVTHSVHQPLDFWITTVLNVLLIFFGLIYARIMWRRPPDSMGRYEWVFLPLLLVMFIAHLWIGSWGTLGILIFLGGLGFLTEEPSGGR